MHPGVLGFEYHVGFRPKIACLPLATLTLLSKLRMNAKNCQESSVSEKEHLNLTKFGQLCCKDPCLGSLRKINLLLTTRDLRGAIAPQ